MSLAIVIPTYNERETLPSLIDELEKVIEKITDKWWILIVDDGSPDGTGKIAEGLCQKYKNITVIDRKTKLGLGSAYKEGFKFALDKYNPDFIVEMDADYSHDPNEIVNMINHIHGYDYVIASRHVPGSSTVGWNSYRKTIHLLAGTLAGLCGEIKISDPTSGFRIFKNKTLDSINFSQIRSDGFAFQIEMLYYLKKLGFRGIELPTRFVNREKGKSKMGASEAAQFIKICLFLLIKRINPKKQ